jgi:hypothetical protein
MDLVLKGVFRAGGELTKASRGSKGIIGCLIIDRTLLG